MLMEEIIRDLDYVVNWQHNWWILKGMNVDVREFWLKWFDEVIVRTYKLFDYKSIRECLRSIFANKKVMFIECEY